MYFFFKDPAPTEIYTLSLHDALPICQLRLVARQVRRDPAHRPRPVVAVRARDTELPPSHAPPLASRPSRSEEHTSELQSRQYLVCRLLLEKNNTTTAISCTPSLQLSA